MATQWYWRQHELPHGPVSFRELVAMVRNRVLEENTPVRPHYSSEWQEAASVIGLFHMAGRADLLAKWEEEHRQQESIRLESENVGDSIGGGSEPLSFVDIDEMLRAAEPLTDMALTVEEPTWSRRLAEVEAQRASDHAERRETFAAERIQRLKDQAIAAAMANVEFETTNRNRWNWHAVNLQEIGSRFLPWVLSIAAAVLIATSVLFWSQSEAQRYPDRPPGLSSTQVFPIWGKCAAEEFTLLLLDTMLVAAVVGYIAGLFLIKMADE